MTAPVATDENASHDSSKVKTELTRSWTGYVFAFISTFCNAGGAFFFKVVHENKLKVVLIRNMFQFLIFVPYMTYHKKNFWGSNTKTNLLLLLRGILSPIVMTLCGNAMNYLTLGDTLAIFYTYPALVGIFAWICIKERCGILSILLTAISMVGFILVAQPPFIFGETFEDDEHSSFSRIFGVLLSFGAAIFAALVCVILRKLGPSVHFSIPMLFAAWEGALFPFIVMVVTGESMLPCFHSLAPIMGVTVCYTVGMIFSTLAIQREKAGPISVIQTNQVIIAFLLQFIFFGEVPNVYCAVGASLIMFSCISLALKNIFKTRKLS